MQKRSLLIGIIFIGIGIGFLAYQYQNTQTPPSTTQNEKESQPSASTYLPSEDNSTPRYIIYTPAAFEVARGKKRVLFFYASWCPTCKPADRDFQTYIDQIPKDVVLFRADYDTERELKTQYSITYQHTFVLVDDSGNAVKIWNGGRLKELVENTQ